MIVSPIYKHLKCINFSGDTFTISNTRSSIIRTIGGCNHYQKTDKIPSVYDRAVFTLPYADMIITDHTARSDGYVLHGQADTKPKTYPNIEMIPILVFYSYATKYHKLTSMFVPGYQCSNIYIDVEKGTLINKNIQ